MSSLFVENQQLYGVECGGNATKGYYIKYADGRLICYGYTPKLESGTLSAVGNAYWGYINYNYSFPMAFIERPYVANTTRSSNIATCIGSSITTTGIPWIAIMSPQPQVSNVYVMYMAIGRWK